MPRNRWLNYFDDNSITSLTTAQLRQAEKSLSKQVNQRMLRLERSGIKGTTVTTTLRKRMESLDNLTEAGRVGTKEKSRSATIASINAMRDFIEAETSTVAGLQKYKKEQLEGLAKNFNMDISEVARLQDAMDFAKQDRNARYNVDSGTVAIAQATAGKGKRAYFRELRKYGYEIKDQRARNFYSEFATRLGL